MEGLFSKTRGPPGKAMILSRFLVVFLGGDLVDRECYKEKEGYVYGSVDSKGGLEEKPWHNQGINLLRALEMILRMPATMSTIR